jgi:hypothetical protein
MSAARAAIDGLRAAWGRKRLVLLLLAVNVFVAGLLAVPMASVLREDLKEKDAAGNMLYGFDHAWWTAWHTGRTGITASFRPDIFGSGLGFKNLELLLRGTLPARAFESREDALNDYPVDPAILGLGVLYMLVQAFLGGGILAALRGERGAPPLRGFLHGCGFYFGRILRVVGLMLLLDAALFWLNAPFAAWAEERAREAASESTALAFTFGRNAVLLLALLLVSLLSGYTKLIVVLEDRKSALLAALSAFGFCLRHLRKTFGHLLLLAVSAVLLVALWSTLDGAFETTGYKTQILALLLSQGLVAGLIGLRVALAAGQIALFRSLPRGL